MPYYVGNSGLGAASSFLTGYMGAQRQRQLQDDALTRQKALDAQNATMQQATLANMASEQSYRKHESDLTDRKSGIDPTTGKPFVLPQNLTQVAPNNHGAKATPDQLIAHLHGLSQFYASQGDFNAANEYRSQIADVYNQQKAQQAIAMQIATLRERVRHDSALESTARARVDAELARVQIAAQRGQIAATRAQYEIGNIMSRAQQNAITSGAGLSPDVANILAKGRTGELKPNEVRSNLIRYVHDPATLNILLTSLGTGKVKFAPTIHSRAPMTRVQFDNEYRGIMNSLHSNAITQDQANAMIKALGPSP